MPHAFRVDDDIQKIELPQRYDEWLALSDDQRELIKSKWDVYNRDGYGFPLTAAGRLVIASDVKVYQAMVGTYHGGEYILMMYVHDELLPTLPPRLVRVFEGFRVYWLPCSTLSSEQ